MKKIELDIVALSQTVAQSNNYAIVLGEKNGSRRLPIIIGNCEAQSIALALEGMQPTRPLTHDLIKNIFGTFAIELKEVVINNLLEGIFYARLICSMNGEIFEIDTRSSDAIALVVRHDCPIYTYEFILEAAGIEFKDVEENQIEESSKEEDSLKVEYNSESGVSEYANFTITKLKKMLAEAIEKEDYLAAAQIRDEMKNR
jgi:bifunctional DNase/RNase